jgi:hypothetical protein
MVGGWGDGWRVGGMVRGLGEMVGGVGRDCWRMGDGVESGIRWAKGGGDGLRVGEMV